MLSSRESYEELFQNVLCGIVQIGLPLKADLQICKINKKAENFLKAFGYDGEKDPHISVSYYMDEDNQKYARQIFTRLEKEGDSQPFLLQLYNGVIEGVAEYIVALDQTPVIQVYFLELGEEIAIRRREATQKELLESVLQSVRCGVVRYGYTADEEKIILVNRAGWELLGFESEQQCIEQGQNGFLPRVHPDDRRVLLRAQYSLNEVTEKRNCEFRIQNGQDWIWLAAQMQCLRDAGGNRVIQMTLMDITASKELEKEKEAENSEIINSLGTIYKFVIYIDVKADHYRFVKGKEASEMELFSGCYSKDLDSLGVYTEKMCSTELYQCLSLPEFCEYYRTNGAFYEQEYKMPLPNGDHIYYQIEAVLSGKGETLEHITLGLRDITSIRKQQIFEHEALEAAYKAETLANRAKTEFLSRMSHDIRTPMNAIIGLTQLMREELDETEKMRPYLDQIDSASQLLMGLINDVLDMSRIESGHIKLNMNPFRLDKLLDQINHLFASQINEHHHRYLTDFSLDTVEYMGDELHIKQILTNILSNAVKFTADGGDISFCVWSNEEGIHFKISDNGIGMSDEFIQRIYQPFEREENAQNIQGTGLGMSIVGSMVHLMNGWIEIKSKPGIGSTFHVMLPLHPMVENEEIENQENIEVIEKAKPDLHKKQILIVEDNEINRLIARRLLQNLGAKVEEARDGAEAVERFQNSLPDQYDLIFMDVRMPNMDGYEATRQIRKSGREDAKRIPIVAMTANAFAEDIHEALQAGMDAHLAKPIQVPALYHILYEWLKI